MLSRCFILRNMHVSMAKVCENIGTVKQYRHHEISYDEAVAKIQQIQSITNNVFSFKDAQQVLSFHDWILENMQ